MSSRTSSNRSSLVMICRSSSMMEHCVTSGSKSEHGNVGQMSENYPDLNPNEKLWSALKKQVEKQKPTDWDQLQTLRRPKSVTISLDLVQEFMSSGSERFTQVRKKMDLEIFTLVGTTAMVTT
ncbi:hypothetical protein ATANTOWER_027485 [Ataeniobius toweri]|uniref:Uncharacterized protein n=1 Tax=Ataeniobius toweri TaxID=208326 RepID=A0ABU7B8S4_9TELE|nr:hypothetical protein [Ataeniobius toweri]